MRWTRSIFLTALALGFFASAYADEYRDARAELVAAYQAQEFDKMVIAAERSLKARPGYPGALFNLALAQALNKEAAASLSTLGVLLDKGIDFGAAGMDQFAILHDEPGWAAYASGIDALYEPAGNAVVALQLDDGHFVPEGIAVDADGRIYVGSVVKGTVHRGANVLSDKQGHWSVFGMRFHDDGGLWFASAAVAEQEGVAEDLGRTGLFRLDVKSGEITRSVELPRQDGEQLLGDLLIDGDSVFSTDSLGGAVYRYDIGADELSTVIERGDLVSPQGLALDASGENLYVADYVGGLYRISLKNGSKTRLDLAESVTDYGIDGLYRYNDELIAIQNGIRPHRVMAFRLSADGLAIDGARTLASNLAEFDEPTLGAIHGDDFYFVANSHWNQFDAESKLPDGLSGPIILILSLASK
jgi:sugar lactone lactonase YvrE